MIPSDIRWVIEAKVHLACEFSDSFISYVFGLKKSIYTKKRRATQLRVCYKCAR